MPYTDNPTGFRIVGDLELRDFAGTELTLKVVTNPDGNAELVVVFASGDQQTIATEAA